MTVSIYSAVEKVDCSEFFTDTVKIIVVINSI